MEIFLPIFSQLEQAKVRYLLTGGLATVFYGYTRLTGDIDLILDLDPENCRNALNCFSSMNFKPRAPVDILDFADRVKRESWIRDKGLKVFSLYAAKGFPIEIDLFVEEPLPFTELASRATAIDIEGVAIKLIGIADLIQLKQAANRPKDIEDVRALQLIRNHGSNT